MSKNELVHRILTHRRLPSALALLALCLTLPGLWVGWSVDDHFHRLALEGADPFGFGTTPPMDLFRFLDGNPELTRTIMDSGMVPWWTLPELRASFWRPLTAMTHILDHALWPELPELMHLQSLLWFAALVAAVTALYRRAMGPTWAAGLAALLWAVDDAHGWPVGWLANRNALLATLFGVMALSAHIRWRRDGWRWGAWLGPAWLVLGILSAEAAIATGAYLAAYALFLDRGKWWERLLRLTPQGGIIAVWWIAHHRMGYGIVGSGLYLDPTYEPVRFAQAVVERGPILLLGQWGLPPSALSIFVSGTALWLWWTVAVVVLLAIAAALGPLLKRDPLARFWGLGMLLSLLPICATFPHDRLLFFTGLGAMGLLAQFLAALRGGAGRRATRVLAALLVAVHGVWAPLSLPPSTWSPALMDREMERDVESLPDDPALASKDLILVNPPIPFLAGYYPLLRAIRQRSVPAHTRILASGTEPLEIFRPDERSLRIRRRGGFLSGPMDELFRGASHPMSRGERVELTGMTVEIVELTRDRRPAEVIFRFAGALEDPSLLWLQWRDGGPVPFAPPPVGATLTLPAQPIIPLARLIARDPGEEPGW
ncbi:MAG: hypothetical protein GY856_23910 [bacterium]|nr:hypothetical protein [bacterium]